MENSLSVENIMEIIKSRNFISTGMAAKALGCTTPTVRHLVDAGKIIATRSSRSIKIHSRSLVNYINKNTNKEV
jgi:excisionase family DNA binding protein